MDVDTNKRSAEGAAEAPAPKRSREDDDNADVAMAVSFPPPANVTDAAYVKTMDQYKEMHNQSLQSPESFWGDIAKTFHWEKTWDEFHYHNYNMDNGKVEIRWFKGALTNMCYNCLDRQVEAGHGDRVAFYWEGNEPSDTKTATYSDLLGRVQRFANVLKAKGIKKGDNVAIYMPMVLELIVAMLACARIGAPHSIVFGGFSAEALADRIIDAESRVVITADGTFRGKKLINLKQIVDQAVEKCTKRGFNPEHVIVAKNLGDKMTPPAPVNAIDSDFHELEAKADAECPVEWVDAEDPLFLLYTSGSTGRPKGVVHSTGGYMVWASTTHKYSFDYHPEDVYFCTADIGWITGHSYITYGPLLNCATSVMFEGVPSYPDYGRFWQIVERYKVNQFYTAPTAIRTLQRQGDGPPKKHDISSLRVLGTVGEPINPEAWNWYYNVVGGGRCSIVDTWWQTETGGHMLTGLPGCTPMKPGAASFGHFGAEPAIVDEKGHELDGPCEGFLVFKRPWPGQMRTVYKDHERYEKTYFERFKGYYFSGDGCRRDKDGYYWITGRVDDVINVSGHRIGTAELESAITRHPDCVEAAIVAVPHRIKGEGIYAFVTCASGSKLDAASQASMKAKVREEIGPFATPDVVQLAPALPKTRSGKIMRRILRKIATYAEDELGDVSTLADPTVVKSLLEHRPPKPQA